MKKDPRLMMTWSKMKENIQMRQMLNSSKQKNIYWTQMIQQHLSTSEKMQTIQKKKTQLLSLTALWLLTLQDLFLKAISKTEAQLIINKLSEKNQAKKGSCWPKSHQTKVHTSKGTKTHKIKTWSLNRQE